LLLWIKEYSHHELVTGDNPLIDSAHPVTATPRLDQQAPARNAGLGVKQQEKLRTRRACAPVYPGAPNVNRRRVRDFLIEKLKPVKP